MSVMEQSANGDTPIAIATETTLLSPALMVEIWFQKYRWLPILHRSFAETVDSSHAVESFHGCLVIKAITIASIIHCDRCPMNDIERERLQEMLRSNILMRAMDEASLRTVQALLILSALDYGDGRLVRARNLLAMCRR
jgi:hypothetical protein